MSLEVWSGGGPNEFFSNLLTAGEPPGPRPDPTARQHPCRPAGCADESVRFSVNFSSDGIFSRDG